MCKIWFLLLHSCWKWPYSWKELSNPEVCFLSFNYFSLFCPYSPCAFILLKESYCSRFTLTLTNSSPNIKIFLLDLNSSVIILYKCVWESLTLSLLVTCYLLGIRGLQLLRCVYESTYSDPDIEIIGKLNSTTVVKRWYQEKSHSYFTELVYSYSELSQVHSTLNVLLRTLAKCRDNQLHCV